MFIMPTTLSCRDYWILFSVLNMLIITGLCFDYETYCRENEFIDGENSDVFGIVDNTNFLSGCAFGVVTEVLFKTSDDSDGTQNVQELCVLDYPTCTNNDVRGQTTCMCPTVNGNIYNYTMSFHFNRTYQGRYLQIDSNCALSGSHTFDYKRCGPIVDPCLNQDCNRNGVCQRPYGNCSCNDGLLSDTNCSYIEPDCPLFELADECRGEPNYVGSIVIITLCVLIVIVPILFLLNLYFKWVIPCIPVEFRDEKRSSATHPQDGNQPNTGTERNSRSKDENKSSHYQGNDSGKPQNKDEEIPLSKVDARSQDSSTEAEGPPRPMVYPKLKPVSLPGNMPSVERISGEPLPPINK